MSVESLMVERRPERTLFILGGVMVGVAVLFLLFGASGQWDFVLPFRGRKLATALLVGYAIAVSTVLFQTVSGNRVLTPAILGFDNLYVFIQTCLLYFLGSGKASSLDPRLRFGVEVLIMVAFSAVLFWGLFGGGGRSLHLVLLTGVVLGVLFRSLASFLQRLIDPNEFIFLQDRFFASFNNPDQELLVVAFALTLVVSVVGLRMLKTFDVLVLGRETAINLGVDHQRTAAIILVLVAILVSVSSALVGPVTFFGLLVSNLAHTLVRTYRHALVLPAAALIAGVCLVAGQFVLEQVFQFNTSPRVIIDFVGGLVFIGMLMRRAPV
ncbi:MULTISPECIES: iron chelate uptake ABC transporter family permease subunit [Myxococcus]|uniref:iron chelate uptake ABC transporter family permease subunit n=1 Tax=Myxococcus TaxID=32 RepID=UPI001E61DF7E|nr:iron chelate uptake ABC transporter family permease subunit [Myxococcus sp. AB025B]MCK8497015.1 iron chelate uptake ABC transporter family permease subunit [Myxococcus fulvus]